MSARKREGKGRWLVGSLTGVCAASVVCAVGALLGIKEILPVESWQYVPLVAMLLAGLASGIVCCRSVQHGLLWQSLLSIAPLLTVRLILGLNMGGETAALIAGSFCLAAGAVLPPLLGIGGKMTKRLRRRHRGIYIL